MLKKLAAGLFKYVSRLSGHQVLVKFSILFFVS